MKGEAGPQDRKEILRRKLLELKKTAHTSKRIAPDIGMSDMEFLYGKDLELYIKERKTGQQTVDNSLGWRDSMDRMYEGFTDDELQELLDQLRAD